MHRRTRCVFVLNNQKTHTEQPAGTMANPAKFIREVRQEVGKVVWPTRREALISTAMILVLLLISALFFLLIDNIASWGVKQILGLGG